MIEICPLGKDDLIRAIEKVYGNNEHRVTFIEIDEIKRQVKWKFDNQTWIQGQSFEVINVLKLTGKNPLELFKEEYNKTHPNQVGLSMPNIPAMLESWAREYNLKHQKN